ncbi:MAG: winged helix-turn-helix domain-containing protein, partial [Chloroflexota bacterium]|nr:winged helix-turn-helix domain-containing protein [Chloroflexota bacterium]
MSTGKVLQSQSYTLLICLFGSFRVLQGPNATPVAVGGKAAELLCQLALRHERPISREQLLDALWPEADPMLAGQSFNNLVSVLRRLFKDALAGAPLLLHSGRYYQLNVEAGVDVDVACFDRLTEEGERYSRAGRLEVAVAHYRRAVALYHGDLC